MLILSKITAISQEILKRKIWFAGNGKKNATLHKQSVNKNQLFHVEYILVVDFPNLKFCKYLKATICYIEAVLYAK